MKIKIFILILISQISFAQHHLEPSDSYFDLNNIQYDYYQRIRSLLFEDLAEPKIRMIVLPSFSKEYILQIEENKNSPEILNIVLREPVEGSIWTIQDENPKLKINTKTYNSKLSKEDFSLLYQMLYSAIINARFKIDDSMGLDGTTYYFSIWDNGMKSAKIWSPRYPQLEELVNVMQSLAEKIKTEKVISFSNEMKDSIVDLTDKFNKNLTLEDLRFLLKFNRAILEITDQNPLFEEADKSFTKILLSLYDDVEESVRSNGIQFSDIDEIILKHQKTYTRTSIGISSQNKEFEKELKERNPFNILLEQYKKNL